MGETNEKRKNEIESGYTVSHEATDAARPVEEGNKELKKKKQRDKKTGNDLGGATESERTENVRDSEMTLIANTEDRVTKKMRNEKASTAREGDAPVEELKPKKKKKKKKRIEDEEAALNKIEATTGDVEKVVDSGATKTGKKRKRDEREEANEVQLDKTEALGDEGTLVDEQKRMKKNGKAKQDTLKSEEKRKQKKDKAGFENGMNHGVGETVTVDEDIRKKKKKKKT